MVLAHSLRRAVAIVLSVVVIGVPLSMLCWFGLVLAGEHVGPALAVLKTVPVQYLVQGIPLVFAAWLGNRVFLDGNAAGFSAGLLGALGGVLLLSAAAIPANLWYSARFIRSDEDISMQYLANVLLVLPIGALFGAWVGWRLLCRWRASHPRRT